MFPTRVLKNHLVFSPCAQARAIFPEMKEAVVDGSPLAAVPHTIEAARLLRNLGYDAHSPIRYTYDWPRRPGINPRPHQVETSDFFVLNPRNHCHNAMRLGKTLSTLWGIDYLQKEGTIQKALVVAPLSTLERVWGDEIFVNFPRKKFAVLYGSAEKRKKLLDTDQDIYIVNHDGVEILLDELMKRPDINLIVLDELAVYRNSKTNRWKAMNKIVNLRGVETWCWGLTGTPIPNEPTDAYGQAKLVRPEALNRSTFTSFKNQVMQQMGPFRWVTRRGAEDIVKRVLSPSIRFERSEVTDLQPCLIERHAELSPQQRTHLNELLKQATTEIDGTQVTAVNAAILVSKIIQTSCIAHGTPVLCQRGWVEIQDVALTDLVWDGEEWVTHDGVLDKGTQPTIVCGGIRLTADHEMLGADGWETAGRILSGNAGKGFNWTEVRLPNGYSPSGVYYQRGVQEGHLDMSMRLWNYCGSNQPESPHETSAKRQALWLPPWRAWCDSRAVADARLQDLDSHAETLQRPKVQRLSQLRRSGHYSLRDLANLVRGFLGRHAARLFQGTHAGADRQQRTIPKRKLSVGDRATTVEQQTFKRSDFYTQWGDDCSRGSTSMGAQDHHPARPYFSLRHERVRCTNPACVPVFDIANCGPRSRFVARGEQGELRIVHNCGVVYGAGGEFLEIDFGPRLKVLEELIEENNGEKVIVFVPFTGALDAIARELKKRWTVAVVVGGVSAGARNKIFADFQHTKDPHVLVAHPGTMAHGLELTRASLIVWYAPFPSNETYQQACARIDGGGQKSKIDIAHISSTPTERKIYAAIRERQKLQTVVLSLLQNNRRVS